MTTITYDSFNLQGNGVFVTETDLFSAPARDIAAESLAEADGSVIVKVRVEPKVFRCEGYLIADTIAELDTLIDSFKTALNKQEQYFDIGYAGSTRRYVATPRNLILSRGRGLNSAGWSVEFYCASPVGSDTSTSTLLASTNVTVSQQDTNFTVDGSYKAEPVISVTVDSVTGGTDKTITISNATTLRGIAVTRTWSASDVLEIDCLNKTVFVNDTTVEYTGQFPAWEPGNTGISYLDDLTTRSVDIEATYTVRYL